MIALVANQTEVQKNWDNTIKVIICLFGIHLNLHDRVMSGKSKDFTIKCGNESKSAVDQVLYSCIYTPVLSTASYSCVSFLHNVNFKPRRCI